MPATAATQLMCIVWQQAVDKWLQSAAHAAVLAMLQEVTAGLFQS
jgi:hypothetical protein